jgi:hypothetical protein
VGRRQRRQPIVQPSNSLAGVKGLGRFAQALGGFDRHHLEIEPTQPGRVAARSRPDVEGKATRARRQNIQKGGMDVFGAQLFVAGGERLRAFVVSPDGISHLSPTLPMCGPGYATVFTSPSAGSE